jgi:hypothetical protein
MGDVSIMGDMNTFSACTVIDHLVIEGRLARVAHVVHLAKGGVSSDEAM